MRGLEGIHKSVDAILVKARNLDELEERIQALMRCFEEHGVMVSKHIFAIGTTLSFG